MCALPHTARGSHLWSKRRHLPIHTFHLTYEKGGKEAKQPPSFTPLWFRIVTEPRPWPQKKRNAEKFLSPATYQCRRWGTISDYSNLNLVWGGKTTEVREEYRLPYILQLLPTPGWGTTNWQLTLFTRQSTLHTLSKQWLCETELVTFLPFQGAHLVSAKRVNYCENWEVTY